MQRYLQQILAVLFLIAISIILLPFFLLHENISNPAIHHYKSIPSAPRDGQKEQSKVIDYLSRLKTQSQLLLQHKPQAWVVKSSGVLSAEEGNNLVNLLRSQKISAYTEVVNPKKNTVQIKLGPVVKRQEAEVLLQQLKNNFPQLHGVIMRYEPLKD
jgi:hypothetical protein